MRIIAGVVLLMELLSGGGLKFSECPLTAVLPVGSV